MQIDCHPRGLKTQRHYNHTCLNKIFTPLNAKFLFSLVLMRGEIKTQPSSEKLIYYHSYSR